jgi:hypothetical protein
MPKTFVFHLYLQVDKQRLCTNFFSGVRRPVYKLMNMHCVHNLSEVPSLLLLGYVFDGFTPQ